MFSLSLLREIKIVGFCLQANKIYSVPSKYMAQTSNKKGKYSYFCGGCGENCQAEAPETNIQKEYNVLQQLHEQNNDLIEHIKYLSKRNEDLNRVIQSRLKAQQSSLNKQRARSNTGIIYRNKKYIEKATHNDQSYQIKPTAMADNGSSGKNNGRSSPKTENYQIIKSSHLQRQLNRQYQNREYTPKKKSIFGLAEEASGTHHKNGTTSQKYQPANQTLNQYTRSKTPTKQLNYLPIYQQKRTGQTQQKIIPAKNVPNYEVTFRQQTNQEARANKLAEQSRIKKRTNQPYLAMLGTNDNRPDIYYPHYHEQAYRFPERHIYNPYAPPLDHPRRRLYSEY